MGTNEKILSLGGLKHFYDTVLNNKFDSLDEKISNILSGMSAEPIKFKGYVNVNIINITEDGEETYTCDKTQIDAIYDSLQIGEACLVAPSMKISMEGATEEAEEELKKLGVHEDSYLAWISTAIGEGDILPINEELLKTDITNILKGEVRTYFVLDKDNPYWQCPDMLLLAKIKVKIKPLILSGAISVPSAVEIAINLLPDDTEITACVGKILRWSAGDWLVKNINNFAPALKHSYEPYNTNPNYATETGIIAYTLQGGPISGERFTIIVNTGADTDASGNTTVQQIAYGRTGTASNRVWTRIGFSGVWNNWIEISDNTDILPNVNGWLLDPNSCLKTGVYQTCNASSISGFSNNYFTMFVNASTTPNADGWNAIEQTAYGRDADTGKIYKRLIFKKTDGTTQRGEWVRIDSDFNTDFNITKTTYSDLVALINGSLLSPGAKYHITDYVTTSTQDGTKSAGHQFDIIVTAKSRRTLIPLAKAVAHEGDTYFEDCNIDAWKIWYDINNDTNKYAWATSTGKGVIYRMIDENGNDCPYDFKNILFEYTSQDLVDNVSTDNYYYTFGTVNSNGACADVSASNNCNNNVISRLIKTIEDSTSRIQFLNKIIFICRYKGQSCMNNTFEDDCENNNFRGSCKNNTFGYSCTNNIFGDDCENNTFGYSCTNNTFGNNCENNTFGYSCTNNIFGDDCENNNFGNSCTNNTFGNNCENNNFRGFCDNITFGNNCYSNSFGEFCKDSTFGNSYENNTFGNSCYSNSFGKFCKNNTFGDDCDNNTFGEFCKNNTLGDYCENNTFGNNCDNNTFGDHCNNNTVGDDCNNNTLGIFCKNNTFGNNCDNNTFGDHCNNNTVGDDCNNNTLGNICNNNTLENNCDHNTLGNNCGYISINESSRLITVTSTISGTDSSPLELQNTRISCELKVTRNSSYQLVIYCPADLLVVE